MSLKIGIVGLPNVGKSTLFNALCRTRAAQAANFPFCTIDPNVGRVELKDLRLAELARVTQSKTIIPASCEFVDIAGLVAGASQGEGLGNAFLSHIRECDVIVHVVRFFSDDNIIHVSGSIDPKRDHDVILTELILADMDTAEKHLAKYEKKAATGDKEAQIHADLGKKLRALFDQGVPARLGEYTEDEKEILQSMHLLSQKPMVYAANVSEQELAAFDAKAAKEKLKLTAQEQLVPVCAKLEEDLMELTEEEQKEFVAELGVSDSGIDNLIHTAYDALSMMYFFTAGEIEVRAWGIKKGSTAPEAAGAIHTDFIKKFIKAEVSNYEDFVTLGGWNKAKEVGKMRLEGKDYIMKDGDVVYFKIGG